MADKLYGNGGNDKLFGLAGNDLLSGGPGNDVLSGGPGADTLACGPGRDTGLADGRDKIGTDCETVRGVPKPVLDVTGVSLVEGNSGTQSLRFAVALENPSPLRVSVAYATANGTATAGSDYTATSGTLVFAPGDVSKEIAVPIVGDTAFEPDETLTLTISNPVNGTIGTATATGTITNDDIATATPGHYNGPISSGGNIDFDVAGDGRNGAGVTLLFYISCDDGTAGLLPISYRRVSQIRPDLTFDWSTSGSDFTIALKGQFNNTTNSAAGTLQVHLTDGGTSCDTGASTWTATHQ
jgi:Ca2+-binding RTX toxin-like protein